jgi:uncharacterized membrane protein
VGQVIQLVGAFLVLGAFVANQRMGMRSDSVAFLVLNAVGTAILAVVAALGRDIGFLILEGVWSIVSPVRLVGVLWGHSPTTRTA